MDLRACYQALGGDYEAVLGRLRQEERVTKFLGRFVEDENFGLLTDALAQRDYPTAFRAVHSLKGVALNLAFTDLANSSSALTEVLRPGTPTEDPEPLYQAVKADYEKTLNAIQALTGGGPA